MAAEDEAAQDEGAEPQRAATRLKREDAYVEVSTDCDVNGIPRDRTAFRAFSARPRRVLQRLEGVRVDGAFRGDLAIAERAADCVDCVQEQVPAAMDAPWRVARISRLF